MDGAVVICPDIYFDKGTVRHLDCLNLSDTRTRGSDRALVEDFAGGDKSGHGSGMVS